MPQWSYRRDLPHLQRREGVNMQAVIIFKETCRCFDASSSGRVARLWPSSDCTRSRRRRPVRQDQSILHLQGVVTLDFQPGQSVIFQLKCAQHDRAPNA